LTGNGTVVREEGGWKKQPEMRLNVWRITIFRNTTGIVGFIE
jgi:hypothetical protein